MEIEDGGVATEAYLEALTNYDSSKKRTYTKKKNCHFSNLVFNYCLGIIKS